MRKDMKRVIITPGRSQYFGFRNSSHDRRVRAKRALHDGRHDDLPTHEPMSMGRGSKAFTDHLGPAERFLHKRVGRPWNDVWSEICEHADNRSVDGEHLRIHVKRDLVETSHGEVVRRRERFGAIGGLYVDGAGVLRAGAAPGWKVGVRARRKAEKEARARVALDRDGKTYRKVCGIWYAMVLGEGSAEGRDAWRDETPDAAGPARWVLPGEGRTVQVPVAGTIRQLGKRDLRRLGLKNDPVAV